MISRIAISIDDPGKTFPDHFSGLRLATSSEDKETTNSLETRLNPQQFLRIHRSTLVNLKRIKEPHPMFHGEVRVILQDNTQLTSGRNYSKNLQKLLNNL
jgi:DNA-binding LytR/AlgR family response regulator